MRISRKKIELLGKIFDDYFEEYKFIIDKYGHLPHNTNFEDKEDKEYYDYRISLVIFYEKMLRFSFPMLNEKEKEIFCSLNPSLDSLILGFDQKSSQPDLIR